MQSSFETMRVIGVSSLCGVVSLLAVACGGGPASELAAPPSVPLQPGQSRATVQASQERPLIIEWSGDQRTDLEAAMRSGVVVVRYAQTEMAPLYDCKASSEYVYVPVEKKRDELWIKDENELNAAIPLGAVRLSGELRQSKQLGVSMTFVGKYVAARREFGLADLKGRCEGATHIIGGMVTGAFELSAGGNATVGAGAAALGAEAGGRASAERRILRRDGNEASCQSTRDDLRPPAGCGALLRLDAVPLTGAAAAPVPGPPKPARRTFEVKTGDWSASSSEIQASRQLFVEGFDSMEHGDFSEARDRFDRAYQLVPAPTALFRLAQCLAATGDRENAAAAYQAILDAKFPPTAPSAFQFTKVGAKEELAKLNAKPN